MTLLLLLIVLGALVVYRVNQGAGRGSIGALILPARVVSLAANQDINVGAGAVQRWEWIASADQPTCHLSGHVQVTDGGNRDVRIAVMNADDYANMMNGHEARAYLSTDKVTALTLDVTTTQPGPKVLAISNLFSVFTGKRVHLNDVQVSCQ